MLRTRRFYFLLLGFGFAFSWFYLLAGFGVVLFEQRGLDAATASVAFGAVGGISIGSRLASGAVADSLGYGRTYILSLCCALVGCILLLFPGILAIYAAIGAFGVSLGGITTLYVPIAPRTYDPEKGMAVIGILSIGLGMTAIGAPPLTAVLLSRTGSFIPVIGVTIATVVVAIVLIRAGTRPG